MKVKNNTYKLHAALADEFTAETYNTMTSLRRYYKISHPKTRFWHYLIPPTTTVMSADLGFGNVSVNVKKAFWDEYEARIRAKCSEFEEASGYEALITVEV